MIGFVIINETVIVAVSGGCDEGERFPMRTTWQHPGDSLASRELREQDIKLCNRPTHGSNQIILFDLGFVLCILSSGNPFLVLPPPTTYMSNGVRTSRTRRVVKRYQRLTTAIPTVVRYRINKCLLANAQLFHDVEPLTVTPI